ncbi:MAG: hypothetical protein ABH804_02415 [archaeon]
MVFENLDGRWESVLKYKEDKEYPKHLRYFTRDLLKERRIDFSRYDRELVTDVIGELMEIYQDTKDNYYKEKAEILHDRFHPKKKIPERKLPEGSLEKKMIAVAAIFSFLGALFFISINLTSYSILNTSSNTNNLLGTIFFVAGLIATYFYFRKN